MRDLRLAVPCRKAVLALAAAAALACSSAGRPEIARPPPPRDVPLASLEHAPLSPRDVVVQPEGRTVEESWLLDLYTLLHRRDYEVVRLLYPGATGSDAVAHLALPHGEARVPLVIVFPILGGTHVTSELMSKVLVARGFAVARLERQPLGLETASDIRPVVEQIRLAILDARRLLDWLETHPRIDPARIASAGTSLGSLQAATLLAVDDRVRAGLLLLSGGGLAEILAVSRERPVRIFRERLMGRLGLTDPQALIESMRPVTRTVDPLTFAHRVDPAAVMLVSGRFDRVIPPARARALWEALGRPRWDRVPAGHYQAFPFLFHALGRGARHLRERLDAAEASAPVPGVAGARLDQLAQTVQVRADVAGQP